MPKRIQRKRTKGWKMPPNTVYVGRPTKWGNPYKLLQFDSAENCIDAFLQWLLACNHRSVIDVDRVKAELRGKDLACWCPPGQPCHADVLLEVANAKS